MSVSDPREALVRAMLNYDGSDAAGRMQPTTARGWAEHVADDILAEFLVVPRTEVVGTEYARECRCRCPHENWLRRRCVVCRAHWVDVHPVEPVEVPDDAG